MKKAIQNARGKRNWTKMFGVGAVFAVCLLNLQIGLKTNGNQDVSLAVLSGTVQAQGESGTRVRAAFVWENGPYRPATGCACNWDGDCSCIYY